MSKSNKRTLVDVVRDDFAATCVEMFQERKAAAPRGTKDFTTGRYMPTEYDIKKKYMPILKDMALMLQGYGVKLDGLGKEALTYEPEPESWLG